MKSCDENGLSTGQKIDDETASNEFERFSRTCDIQSDLDEMTPEDIQSFEPLKKRIVLAIKTGQAIVDDKGELDYKLSHPGGAVDSLHFRRMRGTDLMSFDDHKERQSVKKIYSLISAMTGHPLKFISALQGIDLMTVMDLGKLFLGS